MNNHPPSISLVWHSYGTRNMVTSLIQHERIETTLPKAKELRRIADQVVTLAKSGTWWHIIIMRAGATGLDTHPHIV